jgi:type III pantothenate kinase
VAREERYVTVLLIDVGNTRIKWRAVDARQGFAPDDATGSATPDRVAELETLWRPLVLDGAWMANVAGATRALLVEERLPRGTIVHRVGAQSVLAGVTNGYREPEKLGADRWCALVGARALFPSEPVVIASFGTASTIDLLDADGTFAGGVILPGFELMRSSLSAGTADLPLASGRYQVLAQTTDDAITSGIAHAQAGALERFLRLTDAGAQLGPGVRRVLLSGGHAPEVLPLLPFPATIVDNLVLRGLFEVARETLA